MTVDQHNINQYRTFWPRLWAVFLDAGALAVFHIINHLLWNTVTMKPVLLGWSFIYTVTYLTYPIIFVTKFGQTLGKMACGVKILRRDETRATFREALIREIFPVVISIYIFFLQFRNILNGNIANRALGDPSHLLWYTALIPLWYALEMVTMLTNNRRRALHDFIAGTVVVRAKRKEGWLLPILLVLTIAVFVVTKLIPEKNMTIATTSIVESRRPTELIKPEDLSFQILNIADEPLLTKNGDPVGIRLTYEFMFQKDGAYTIYSSGFVPEGKPLPLPPIRIGLSNMSTQDPSTLPVSMFSILSSYKANVRYRITQDLIPNFLSYSSAYDNQNDGYICVDLATHLTYPVPNWTESDLKNDINKSTSIPYRTELVFTDTNDKASLRTVAEYTTKHEYNVKAIYDAAVGAGARNCR